MATNNDVPKSRPAPKEDNVAPNIPFAKLLTFAFFFVVVPVVNIVLCEHFQVAPLRDQCKMLKVELMTKETQLERQRNELAQLKNPTERQRDNVCRWTAYISHVE